MGRPGWYCSFLSEYSRPSGSRPAEPGLPDDPTEQQRKTDGARRTDRMSHCEVVAVSAGVRAHGIRAPGE